MPSFILSRFSYKQHLKAGWKSSCPVSHINSPLVYGQLKMLIFQSQLEDDIIEELDEIVPPYTTEFCLSQNLSSKKIWRAKYTYCLWSKSFNECLEPGPNLRNLVWKILVRSRFNPIAIYGDLKLAFLQVHLRKL